MTEKELREIGFVQLEIMDEIHKICEKENITYYMIAGTLLGAVRHKGFIPWDLDIDIAMYRDEYERFKLVCSEYFKDKYIYLDHENCKYFFRPHALVMKNNTRICVKYDCVNPKLLDLGIYVDIFPLDNAPDDAVLRKKQAHMLQFIRRIKDYRIPYCYSYKRWKRYVHYAVSGLLTWISVRKLNQQQQQQMQKYRRLETQCVCSMGSQYKYEKQCMEHEIYGKPILLEFEGRTYYAPEKYKQYLEQLYGNYMQLPSLEKRKANMQVFTSVDFGD